MSLRRAARLLHPASLCVSTTGQVSGKTGNASMRRSTSRRRTVVGSGLGSSFLRHAPEFGEDLRRQRRGSSAADAPEHLPGVLTFLWLFAVQGVVILKP